MSATLNGLAREKLGSRHARRLRLQNRIPCSVQGEGKPNVALSIDNDEFATARRNHEHLFDIEIEGAEAETAMVRELQWSALGDSIVHVEFRRVVRGQKTQVEVALEFIGHPKGGVLNHLVTHVPVMCLPSEIPDKIEAKVDHLEPGHPLFARDLVMPEGSEMLLDEDTQVAVVSTVRAEEVAEETPEEEGVEGAAEAAAEGEGEEKPGEKPEGE
jgi:large subunit ribosomal protein L25